MWLKKLGDGVVEVMFLVVVGFNCLGMDDVLFIFVDIVDMLFVIV